MIWELIQILHLYVYGVLSLFLFGGAAEGHLFETTTPGKRSSINEYQNRTPPELLSRAVTSWPVERSGAPVVETEIFCVDGDTGMIYSEPVDSVLEQMDSFIAPAPDMSVNDTSFTEPTLALEGFLQAPPVAEAPTPAPAQAKKQRVAGGKRRTKGTRKGRKPKSETTQQ